MTGRSIRKYKMKYLTNNLDSLSQGLSERNTCITLLVIAMCIPQGLTLIMFLLKALFGSQPWPKFRELIQVVV